MRAVVFERFGEMPRVTDVAIPEPSPGGVVVRVETTGLCRSDVSAWLGHDSGVAVPHVPGHELSGTIHAVGDRVARFAVGDRVTVPFVSSCGSCAQCRAGQGQVCPNQTQPGFTHWGSFAEYVALHDADANLIALPDEIDGGVAALLGCRFATAFRALVHQGEVAAGETVVVIGCGGVGLSAIMIARALGATVVAVDISAAALARARELGAEVVIDSSGLSPEAIAGRVRGAVDGGVDVSVDALGREEAVIAAVLSLGVQGRHVQVGLLAEDPRIPLSAVIAGELTLRGSHGMAASAYPELIEMVVSGALRPGDLITRRIGLDEVPGAIAEMAEGRAPSGITVIDVGSAERPAAESG